MSIYHRASFLSPVFLSFFSALIGCKILCVNPPWVEEAWELNKCLASLIWANGEGTWGEREKVMERWRWGVEWISWPLIGP